jgi:hypothetical protein
MRRGPFPPWQRWRYVRPSDLAITAAPFAGLLLILVSPILLAVWSIFAFAWQAIWLAFYFDDRLRRRWVAETQEAR